MRKLGRVQSKVLEALIEYKRWEYHGRGNELLCGWIWETYEGTHKTMESLHKKGLVSRMKVGDTKIVVYRPYSHASEHIRKDDK